MYTFGFCQTAIAFSFSPWSSKYLVLEVISFKRRASVADNQIGPKLDLLGVENRLLDEQRRSGRFLESFIVLNYVLVSNEWILSGTQNKTFQ